MQSEQVQEKIAEKTIEDALLTPRSLGINGRNYILNDDFINATIFIYEGAIFLYKGTKEESSLTQDGLERVLSEAFKPFLTEYSTDNVVKVTKRDSGIKKIDIKTKTSSNVGRLDVFMYLHLDKPYNEVYRAVKKHLNKDLKLDNRNMEARYFWL